MEKVRMVTMKRDRVSFEDCIASIDDGYSYFNLLKLYDQGHGIHYSPAYKKHGTSKFNLHRRRLLIRTKSAIRIAFNVVDISGRTFPDAMVCEQHGYTKRLSDVGEG